MQKLKNKKNKMESTVTKKGKNKINKLKFRQQRWWVKTNRKSAASGAEFSTIFLFCLIEDLHSK